MTSLKHILTALLALAVISATAQDIHLSQFWASPANLNPALTGQFNGDYRFVGNQRTQWKSVTVPFVTYGLAADAHDFLEKENLGVGINMYFDHTGDSRFKTTHINLSSSYLFKLDTIHSISAGAQVGFTNRNLSYDELRFDNQYNGLYYDPSLSHNETFARDSRGYMNLNLGAAYHWKIDRRKTATAGISLYNITRPKQSFFDDDNIILDMRFMLHANADYKVTEEIDIMPGLLFMSQGKFKEFDIGSNVRYRLKDEQGIYRAVYAGLWLRNQDAGYIVAGMNYDDWNVGISYDVNLSGLKPASNLRGGFEVSVIYIIRNYKPSPYKHKVCPNYI